MLKPTRINVTRLLNTKAAKKMKRNGRDVIVIPSATMPDDIVMNKVKYPASEIKKSFKSLDKTPAPLNHPMIGGKFVSAKSPEGINVGWVGAWNENVRQENGKVYLDKIIDIEIANRSDEGKRVLEAIEKGDPIHTSTGLFAQVQEVKGQKDYNMVASEIEFDHDAILLDFAGAATPEQGVGIFVNASGESEDITVINSIWEEADRELDWALDSIVRSLEKKARFPIVEKIKAAITEAFSSGAEVTANQEEAEMSKTIDELSAQVTALTESMNGLGKTITDGVAAAFTNALKPLVDAQDKILANEKAKEEAEKSVLIDKVVKANVLDETAAKVTPLETLKALVANMKAPEKPANVRPGTVVNNNQGGATGKFKAPVAEAK